MIGVAAALKCTFEKETECEIPISFAATPKKRKAAPLGAPAVRRVDELHFGTFSCCNRTLMLAG